jgi:hypothetical protein
MATAADTEAMVVAMAAQPLLTAKPLTPVKVMVVSGGDLIVIYTLIRMFIS